ncbi:methylated-DNA--[protein]-cysteine S-methyltransferase [Leucobacter sp. HY1910]
MSQDSPAVCVTLETPDGPFTLIAGALGVLASGWTDDTNYLLPLIHESLRPAESDVQELDPTGDAGAAAGAGAGASPAAGSGSSASSGSSAGSGSAERIAREAAAAVDAYYAGDVAAPGTVPVVQESGPYRERAWEVLRDVAPGEVLTYAEYAARTGNPDAARAAASACAKNAAALFVPCHRVMRSDGTLGGFRYGLPVKERLLAREAAAASGGGAEERGGNRSRSVPLF